MHTSDVVPPTAFEYMPAGQPMHADAPVLVDQEPPWQSVHVCEPDGEYVPAGHEAHAEALVAAGTVEYVPALQFVHVSEPTAIQVPWLHAWHRVRSLLATCSAGQGWHDDAPAPLANMATPHGMHAAAPMVAYEPAVHATHVLEPVVTNWFPEVGIVPVAQN